MGNIWAAILAVVFGFAALIITIQQYLAGYWWSAFFGTIITIGFFGLTVWAVGGDD